MPRDRTWVFVDNHGAAAYKRGCEEFLEFAFSNAAIDGAIRCPCRDCLNRKFGDKNSVHKHLLWRGMYKEYGKGLWNFHNERAEVEPIIIEENVSQNNDVPDKNTRLTIFEYSGKFAESDGVAKYKVLSYDEMEEAHNYCLFNCDEISQFQQEHLETIKHQIPTSDVKYKWRIQCLQNKEFRNWFISRVESLRPVNDDLLSIARSPQMKVLRHKSFSIHGYIFRTQSVEQLNKTQNCGVLVSASTTSFATTRDSNPMDGDVTYFGLIKDILELYFIGDRKIVLFECIWADTEKTRIDSHGFTLVDFTRPARNANPFVLASQVMQVFYVEDPCDSPWKVPVITRPRHYNDFSEETRGGQNDNILVQPDFTSSSSGAADIMEE